MLDSIKRRWFLIALSTDLAVGICFSEPLKELAERLPRNWVVASVLLAMALPLRIGTIWAVLSRPLAALLAVGVNLIALPLMAWGVSPLLSGELGTGLIITAAVPCTIASAAVWTRRAGGNDAIALLVTMITNLLCFVVTPAWLLVTLGETTQSLGSFSQLASKLSLIVVLPIGAAQLLRGIRPIGDWAVRQKHALGVASQWGILLMVFVGAVRSGQTLAELSGQWQSLASQMVLMLMLVVLLHVASWFLGFWLAKRFGLSHEDQLAIAFAGSQKTLMVGLAVALEFGGLAVLPMLSYHAGQLLIDTLLADWQRAVRH